MLISKPFCSFHSNTFYWSVRYCMLVIDVISLGWDLLKYQLWLVTLSGTCICMIQVLFITTSVLFSYQHCCFYLWRPMSLYDARFVGILVCLSTLYWIGLGFIEEICKQQKYFLQAKVTKQLTKWVADFYC